MGFYLLITPRKSETQGRLICLKAKPLGLSLAWGSQKVEPWFWMAERIPDIAPLDTMVETAWFIGLCAELSETRAS